MRVIKRDGSSQELDLQKIHSVLTWACEGQNDDALSTIKGVSVSQIEMNAHLHFYDGMPTKSIHETLIKATSELISTDEPNYDHVAARLVWFAVRKEAFRNNLPPHLRSVVHNNIERKVYSKDITSFYSDEELDEINGFIRHERDDLFRYAGAEQMRKKYLCQNRKNKQLYESFQFPYILVAALLFAKYPKEHRMYFVKKYYDLISTHVISLPTPIMAGLRTKVKQFSSCVLVSSGDSLPSINATSAAIVEYASRKAGLGVDIGRIRAEGQPVRGGDAITTGVLPFAKYFNAALKSCSQGAVRGACLKKDAAIDVLTGATIYGVNYSLSEQVTIDGSPVSVRSLFENYSLGFESATTEARAIQDIQIDDLVRSYDIYKHKEVFKRVTHLHTPIVEHDRQHRIETVCGINITTSNIHPFPVLRNKGIIEYVKTEDVLVGDILLHKTKSGALLKTTVSKHAHGDLLEDEQFFDITVDGTNNYFANDTLNAQGEFILVHNSATLNYPIWHLEFAKLIELKNEKGTEETRLRTCDYCVHLNGLMYRRWATRGNITFFSPEEVPDLYAAFYSADLDKFEALYVQYEADDSKSKVTVPAAEVFQKILTERFETGRIYILHADLVNKQSSFYEPITMTNLCTEITLPTVPLSGNPEEGRIALCTLSAINWGKFSDLSSEKEQKLMANACEMAVRGLDSLLSYQEYPRREAELSTKEYRPLGVGLIGFGHWLAKNHLVWGAPDTLEKVNLMMESMAFHLTEASIKLAEEVGPCEKRTRYHDGWLPMDDSPIDGALTKDWDSLRARAKVSGIRNATLMALMPSETSSQLSNETNGIEPPRSLITIKGSKEGVMPQLVPEYQKLNYLYETLWNVTASNYLPTVACLQRFIDQAMSANTSYDPTKTGGKISLSVLATDLIRAYSLGVKTLYYNNVRDSDGEDLTDEPGSGCDSGACSI